MVKFVGTLLTIIIQFFNMYKALIYQKNMCSTFLNFISRHIGIVLYVPIYSAEKEEFCSFLNSKTYRNNYNMFYQKIYSLINRINVILLLIIYLIFDRQGLCAHLHRDLSLLYAYPITLKN